MVQDEFEFARKNVRAIYFIQNATEDYLAARILFLNGLNQPGYISSEQAIEKLLKSYIALLSHDEDFRGKKYRLHELEILLEKLASLGVDDLDSFKYYCFILSKVYTCMRYPKKKFIADYKISKLSTESIHELDEMFISLFIRLPIPDKNKCRLSILGDLLITKNQLRIKHFITANKAYFKNIHFFCHPLEWWLTSKIGQTQTVTVLNISTEP